VAAGRVVEIGQLLGQQGARVYAILKAGRADVAENLIEQMEDSSPAAAAALQACQKLTGDEMAGSNIMGRFQEQMQAQMAQLYGRGFLADQSPLASFEKAALLDPRWEPLWPHMALDILVAQFQRQAEQGQSLLTAGDDVLLSPDERYDSPAEDGRCVVLARPTEDTPAGVESFDLTALQGRMAVTLLTREKDKHRHFFLGGPCVDFLAKVTAGHPEVLASWQPSLMAVADAFGQHGLYASALLVKRAVWEQSGRSPAQMLPEGIAWLESVADQACRTPESAHRLLVALGYWGEVHADALREAPGAQIKTRMMALVGRSMPVAGVCPAVILGCHLGLDVLGANPSFAPVPEPWRQQAQACAWFEKAEATQNADERKTLLEQAATAGHAPAMEALALLRSRSGKQQEAFQWLAKAAQAGYPSSLNNLGVFYLRGIGCVRNEKKALALCSRAANFGCAEALYTCATVYRSKVHPSNLPVTVSLCSYAAQRGCTEALFDMGTFYSQGNAGLAKSPEKAVECWQKAADKGSSMASYNLYLCSLHGEGTAQDTARALQYLQAAAEGGYNEAMYRLYLHYRDGADVAQDAREATKWLQKAAQYDHPKAREILNLLARYEQQDRERGQSMLPVYQSEAYTPYRSPQPDPSAYQRALEQAERQKRNYRLHLQRQVPGYVPNY
jgi:TPR repeat protein